MLYGLTFSNHFIPNVILWFPWYILNGITKGIPPIIISFSVVSSFVFTISLGNPGHMCPLKEGIYFRGVISKIL